MATASVAVRNSELDAVLRATSYTGTATPFLALHTGDPGATGATEATGGSYVRQAITFNAAASAAITGPVSVINFTGMPAATLTHFSIFTASTAGTYIWGGALSSSVTTAAGNTVQFAAASLTFSIT